MLRNLFRLVIIALGLLALFALLLRALEIEDNMIPGPPPGWDRGVEELPLRPLPPFQTEVLEGLRKARRESR
jgi:hypothetical protein